VVAGGLARTGFRGDLADDLLSERAADASAG